MVPTVVDTSPIAITFVDEVALYEGSELRVGAVSIATVVVTVAIEAVVEATLGPDAASNHQQLGVCVSFCLGVADLHVDDVFA